MKKANIFVNDENNTLVMTKAFYKRACVFGTDEYYALRRAKADNEGYEVVYAYKVADKTTYNGLNFATMEAYIKSQANSEERLMEFEAVKEIAAIKGSKYPLTKKWFLLTYPEFKVSDVSETEQAKVLADKKAKAKAEAEKMISLLAEDLAPAANF